MIVFSPQSGQTLKTDIYLLLFIKLNHFLMLLFVKDLFIIFFEYEAILKYPFFFLAL